MGSVGSLGFQLNHSSDPGFLNVGRTMSSDFVKRSELLQSIEYRMILKINTIGSV